MKKLLLFAIPVLLILAFGLTNIIAGDKSAPVGEKKGKTMDKEYKKRKDSNPEIAIETDFGTMKLELYHDVAPGHVDSMLSRIREGFYNGLIFHRIIDNFMIQGGDPTGTGMGDAGYQLKAEFSKLNHLDGTLSMARAQNPNSASCQFFICLGKIAHLDGQYTIFGQLMEGYDVLHKIGSVETAKQDRPVKDVYMRKVTIIGEEAKADK